jgi:hypothetical protein
MVRWAVQNEYLDANPLDGMNKPAEATSSNRVLSDEEIQTLWKGLPDTLARSEQCQRIVRLCLVTAQRVGEVAGMTRAELDLKAREWRLPGNRTKNGHPHVVPLSDLAISIITEPIAAADADNGHKVEPLFPCGDGSLSPVAVARTILRANEISKDRPKGRFGIAPWSAHDLRRTALTGMARLGVAPIVLGHVANHRTTTRAGVTLAVYSQYTYDKEKRAALELWASHLVTLCGASDAATPNKAPSANLRKVGQSNRRGVGRPAAAPGAKDVDYYQFFLDVGLAIGKPWRPIPIGDMTLEEQSDFFCCSGSGQKAPWDPELRSGESEIPKGTRFSSAVSRHSRLWSCAA